MFSITNDFRYIDEMVSEEMDRYGEMDLLNILLDWLSGWDGKLFIFGAGFAGAQIVRILRNRGICVDNVLDNNRSVWGKQQDGIEIVAPDFLSELGKNTFRVVVGVNFHKEEIYSQLLDMGIEPKFIFNTQKEWWLGAYPQYFDPEIVIPGEHEVFLDGGSLDGGDTIVPVVSIDEKLDGEPATFIKMDIEGSEMEALCGAERTIRTFQPKLAICVYHKPEDIIDIPAKILNLNPTYKLFLMHYSYLQTETVLYAVNDNTKE